MLYSPGLQEIGLKPAPPAQDVTIEHITMILLVIHEEKAKNGWLWNLLHISYKLLGRWAKCYICGTCLVAHKDGRMGRLLCIHSKMVPAVHEWMEICISIFSHPSSDVSHTLMFGKMDRKKRGNGEGERDGRRWETGMKANAEGRERKMDHLGFSYLSLHGFYVA